MNYLTTSVYLALASRKRRNVAYEEKVNEPRGTAAPNICTLPIEGINPTLDPNRALFRRVFFLNDDHSKYVSVAFRPAKAYAALVEFGTAKNASLRLTEQRFTMLTEHLQGLLTVLCADEYYRTGVLDNFSIVTGGSYKTAFMHLGPGKQRKQFVFKTHELQYINCIMHIVTDQLARYSGAMMVVVTYSISALTSSEYIELKPYYSKHIQYPTLYEELKAFVYFAHVFPLGWRR
jgi:hypothetical protein